MPDRDMQNGSSMVTWVENVDIQEKDKELHPKLRPFVESGFAFGARRWISTLQQEAERFIYSTGINISPTDSAISPEGRRSLAMTAKKMKNIEVKTNKRRGDPGKPPGLHTNLQAALWSSFHLRIESSTTSVTYKTDLSGKECCTDATGSYVIFAPIEKAVFQSMLCGVDQDIQLMPFGFFILPNVSGSILEGTLLTMVFQLTVKNVSSKQAVEVVTQIVKDALQKIMETVN
ncbi:hypothetical protein M0R45_006711 [Rubus argutus]|uniref:START domain-containing protein n=1 Tax=Rubus argutus TaxID=59490 RepID=A0AAW1YRA5_RUBAR